MPAAEAFIRPNVELVWPFGDLPVGQARLIMADPAWSFQTRSDKGKGKSPDRHYTCMPLEAIKALPVQALAHPDGCFVWLWATGCMDEMAHEVLSAWGSAYVTQGVWVKLTKDGSRPAFGTGYVLRNSHEPYYIARFGRPKVASRSVRSVIMASRREHSRKPDEAYRDAEMLCGPGVKLDLFSRQSRPGWISWGNEAEKFDPPERLIA